MDHWTVLSPDGRVLAVEEGQRRSKRGKDYVRGRSGCVEPAHRPGGEFTPHFGRGLGTWARNTSTPSFTTHCNTCLVCRFRPSSDTWVRTRNASTRFITSSRR